MKRCVSSFVFALTIGVSFSGFSQEQVTVDLSEMRSVALQHIEEEAGEVTFEHGIYFQDGATQVSNGYLDLASFTVFAEVMSPNGKHIVIAYNIGLDGKTDFKIADFLTWDGADIDYFTFRPPNNVLVEFGLEVSESEVNSIVEEIQSTLNGPARFEYFHDWRTGFFKTASIKDTLQVLDMSARSKSVINSQLDFYVDVGLSLFGELMFVGEGVASEVIAPDGLRTVTKKLANEGNKFYTKTTINLHPTK